MSEQPKSLLVEEKDGLTLVHGKETVLIGYDLVDRVLPTQLKERVPKASKFVIVTDENVARLHGERLQRAFVEVMGVPPLVKVIPAGENTKTRAMKEEIENWMLSKGCTRDTCVVAVGGGVVGDLTGFVASTYMRGVPFVQVPTTLLAMVDSSIGGKTGVNTEAGKNLIGAFHHPVAVFIDLTFLKTLPKREFSNGMAEIIKAGVIRDPNLFQLLENRNDAIMNFISLSSSSPKNKQEEDERKESAELLKEIVVQAVKIKSEVVLIDANESGLRCILNFGHTVGHAIESLCFPALLHGECVSIGMVMETKMSQKMGHLEHSIATVVLSRLVRCLQCYSLPVVLPSQLLLSSSSSPSTSSTDGEEQVDYLEMIERLLAKMKVDKKNANSQIRCVIVKSIGDVYPYPIAVPKDIIQHVLYPYIAVVPTIVNGEIVVPGSKSISNRMLALAGLAEGKVNIHGLLHADDTLVMLSALQELGVRFEWKEEGKVLSLEGSGGHLTVPSSWTSPDAVKPFYLGNAGTASRFLTSMCTLVTFRQDSEEEEKVRQNEEQGQKPLTVLTGSQRLKERPIKDLLEALQENGCDIRCPEKEGYFPLEVRGGGLRGGRMNLSAKISSQYVSSILLSAPYAKEADVELCLKGGGAPVSKPFIDMTVNLIRSFGVSVEETIRRKEETKEEEYVYKVERGKYQNPKEYRVECDASSASYPLAMAAISGGKVTVNSLGSNSLQGDARFYTVLEQMGCRVEQTEDSTTVVSCLPSRFLRAVSVDMSSMTDTFMTVAALCAVAKGTSRITNIANQRVKECNRIEVMCTELSKCGVEVKELEDGLEIRGCVPEDLDEEEEQRLAAAVLSPLSTRDSSHPFSKLHGAYIECHKDHRIAMSFAVLGLVVPGVVLKDKECVDKTYPNFWEDLENIFNVSLVTPLSSDDEENEEKKKEQEGDKKKGVEEEEDQRSIIIIGMRGSGKTTMGQRLAERLGKDEWQFLDLDALFHEKMGASIKEYIQQHNGDWAPFRAAEATLFEEVLNDPKYQRRTVISTGGGIIESERPRSLLEQMTARKHEEDAKQDFLVVQIWRPIEDVVRYLEEEEEKHRDTKQHSRAAYQEEIKAVWRRRKAIYKRCSHFEFAIRRGEKDWQKAESEFLSFIQRIRSGSSSSLLQKKESFFLSLTCKDVTEILSTLPKLSEGVDALELRVDLLQSQQQGFVREQLALLRRYAPASTAVLFTVRSKKQGGRFEGGPKRMLALLALALRSGCHLIDIEMCSWLPEKQPGAEHVEEIDEESKQMQSVLWELMKNNSDNQRKVSLVIGSYHEWEAKPTMPLLQQLFWRCRRFPPSSSSSDGVDIVKVVVFAKQLEDVFTLRQAVKEWRKEEEGEERPVIALAAGNCGRLSRVLNLFMTPVTHPLLTSAAAPGNLTSLHSSPFPLLTEQAKIATIGQLSVAEVKTARAILGGVDCLSQ
ncbi:3-dehydroquinate dehydratase (3-dehydroquinase) [Balamuthia mandrillaris]